MKHVLLPLLLLLPALAYAADAADTTQDYEQLAAFADACEIGHSPHNQTATDALAFLLFKGLKDSEFKAHMLPHLTPDILNTINRLAVPLLKQQASFIDPKKNRSIQLKDFDKNTSEHYFVLEYNLLARMVVKLGGPYVEGERTDFTTPTDEDIYRKSLTMLVPGDTPGTYTEQPIHISIADLVQTGNLWLVKEHEKNWLIAIGQGLTSLDAESIPLKDVTDIPLKTAITHLNCKGNILRTISGLPELTNLKELLLTNNGIVIKEGMFNDLANLETLRLGNDRQSSDRTHDNRLEVLTDKTFGNVPKLKTLSLPNVGLTTIKPDALASLNALRHLNVSRNKLVILTQRRSQEIWGSSEDADVDTADQQLGYLQWTLRLPGALWRAEA